MKHIHWDNYIAGGAAGAGALINYIWGGLDTMFIALVSVMALDFFTGILCAVKTHTVDSKVAYHGITRKKMMILAMVALSVIIDNLLGTPGVSRSLVIMYYFAMEGISILENAAKVDFPVPSKLKKILLQLSEEKGAEDKNEG